MTLRALIRPLLRDPLRHAMERRGGWTPRVLFAAGEQGGWWDPSDFSTLSQDSAGTTPVTAVGQPVGKILDKSGRGNHRTQATAGSRPTLQQDGSGYFYLSYDGVDDSMATASVNFTATDKMSVWAGANKGADAASGVIVELSANSTAGANPGSFGLFSARPAGAPNWGFALFGSTLAGYQATTFTAPISSVLSVSLDIAGAALATEIFPRVNGAIPTLASTDSVSAGTGSFGNYPLFFGERGGTTTPFNGREYQTIIRGAASTATQIAQAERFIGSRMGIAL